MKKPLGKLLTTTEAAVIIGIKPHSVAEYCSHGDIPAYKHGTGWAIWTRHAKEFAKKLRPVGNPNWQRG